MANVERAVEELLFSFAATSRKLSAMKPSIPVFAALLLLATTAFAIDDATRDDRASRNRRVVIVDEVIRMSAAGVADDAIISYGRNTRDSFDVTADDIIAMTDAHVSKDVVKAVVDESAARKDRRGTRDRRYFVAAPYPYYYDPFYYDPFWYGPRFSFGFGFGPRFGGGFRGRHR
jgi:hypothetical protein